MVSESERISTFCGLYRSVFACPGINVLKQVMMNSLIVRGRERAIW